MDFIDMRKLSANLARESQNAGENKYKDEDYSVVALFPIVMIGAVLFVICGAYKIKRCKLEKKQLANLSLFYDVFEETKCEHNSLSQGGSEMGCNRLRAALMIPPPRTSPFFQPQSAKNKKPRFEVPISSSSAIDESYSTLLVNRTFQIGYQLLLFNGEATQAV